MSARLLPILNALGCLILVGFILVQWHGGQSLQNQLFASQTQSILEANARLETEKRADALQSDVDGLKASIEAIRVTSQHDQYSAGEATKLATEKATEAEALTTDLTQAQEQLKQWAEAVKSRDEKLKELNEALIVTRNRLNEAITKLKQAGAR